MKFLHLSKDFQLSSKLLTLQVSRALDSENFMLSAGILHHAYMFFFQNSYNLLCRNFDSGLAGCCHHERYALYINILKKLTFCIQLAVAVLSSDN
jgi:hypothetical protein